MMRVFVMLLLAAITAAASAGLSDGSRAREAAPRLRSAQASPAIVHRGAQPPGNPLILSVETFVGGEISTVTADLSSLSGGRYYDPVTDTFQAVGTSTPLSRVYEIEGQEAYLVKAGAKHSDNEYRLARTHERVKETATATGKWQVEVPDVGQATAAVAVSITAVSPFGGLSNASIPLQVVDDEAPPLIVAEAEFAITSPMTRHGDRVTITAEISDDLCGAFAAELIPQDAQKVFGPNASLALTPDPRTGRWSVGNTVAADIPPGTYPLDILAFDRAGNTSRTTLALTVAEDITALWIPLKKGWNLISVPRPLTAPEVESVFAGLPIESVQTVIGGERLVAAAVEPGRGYLVKAAADALLTLHLAPFDPSAAPEPLTLEAGWNLIGYASWGLEPIMPLTYYLGQNLKNKWAVIRTGEGAEARPASTSPYVWATDAFPTLTGEPFSEDDDNLPVVEIGKGYWIYLSARGVLIL